MNALVKEDRTNGKQRSPTNSKRSSVGRRTSSLASIDASKSTSVFLDTPRLINHTDKECVQFLTLLPHQEKVFYLNLFQRKNQCSSNPISHIEHRTKSRLFMEVSAFDTPVCRIRICAKEKRNIERVLELFDEYCPVLLKYSNHQELRRVRQSLLPMGSRDSSGDVQLRNSSIKLPTLRRLPFTRNRSLEKEKSVKSKMTAKGEKKAEDDKSMPKSGDQAIVDTVENENTALTEPQNGELKVTEEEKQPQPQPLELHAVKERVSEKEKLVSSYDDNVVNNEISSVSAMDSIKLEPNIQSKPPLPFSKSKGVEHRKSATSVEAYQELETVVEGYLEKEREKVEKLKLEETKSENKAIERFRTLVRTSIKANRKGGKKERMRDNIEFQEEGEVETKTQPDEEKQKKFKRKRRKMLRPTASVRGETRSK